MELEVHQDDVNEASLISGLSKILEAGISLMVPIGKT